MKRTVLLALTGLLAAFAACKTAHAQTPFRQRLDQLRRSIDGQLLPPRIPVPVDPTMAAQPRLGVAVQPVSADAVRRYQLTVRRGALISTLEAGSAADRAGLPIGGVIVSFDGVRIDSPDELIALVRSSRPGQKVELGYYDGARLFRKSIHLSPATPNARGLPPAAASEELPPPPNMNEQPTESRPLLDRLGRAMDGILPPTEVELPNLARSAPARIESDVDLLKKQISTLQDQIKVLTQRIADLEDRVGDAQ